MLENINVSITNPIMNSIIISLPDFSMNLPTKNKTTAITTTARIRPRDPVPLMKLRDCERLPIIPKRPKIVDTAFWKYLPDLHLRSCTSCIEMQLSAARTDHFYSLLLWLLSLELLWFLLLWKLFLG